MSEEKVLEEILLILRSIDKKLALLVPKESFQREPIVPSTHTVMPDIKAEIERKRKELMDKFGTPGVSEQKLQELKRKMDLPK